jgi:anti-anti-sigma factor
MQHHFELRRELLDPPAALVALDGDFDLSTATQFRESVSELMGTGRRKLIVDLAHTDFIDSSGMGALLWASRRLRAAGGELVAVNVHGVVDRTFALAHIDEAIQVRRAL